MAVEYLVQSSVQLNDPTDAGGESLVRVSLNCVMQCCTD